MNYENEPQERPRAKAGKKYSPPTLTDYGCVSKLTQGGAFVGNDGNTKCVGNAGGGNNPNCSPLPS